MFPITKTDLHSLNMPSIVIGKRIPRTQDWVSGNALIDDLRAIVDTGQTACHAGLRWPVFSTYHSNRCLDIAIFWWALWLLRMLAGLPFDVFVGSPLEFRENPWGTCPCCECSVNKDWSNHLLCLRRRQLALLFCGHFVTRSFSYMLLNRRAFPRYGLHADIYDAQLAFNDNRGLSL